MSSDMTLDIRLRSDLCVASGDGFSSGIDVDVCRDDRGIPYIPARRLKGCLRDAAQEISMDDATVALLFGEPGAAQGAALSISDAKMHIPDASAVLDDPREATEALTYVRAQTKVKQDTGIVAPETLRYVRVVGRFSPWDSSEETRFRARLSINAEDEGAEAKLWEQLSRAAKVLRNIGMQRNRGLGVVRCAVEEQWDHEPWDVDEAQPVGADRIYRRYFTEEAAGSSREMVALSYVVRLDAPLMLPQANGGRSVDYVPGSSVQGFFAGRLARGLAADFDDVFMSGKVRFSPLYPVRGGERCLPATPLVTKVKGGDDDGLCVLGTDWKDTPGVSVKPLKSGYVDNEWLPVGVRREISYHHSTKHAPGGVQLYMQECVSAGQEFSGYVECPYEYEGLFTDVLEDGTISFGRSKSAQYARCTLATCVADASRRGLTTDVMLQEGEEYVLLLESDLAVASASSAAYETDAMGLVRVLSREFGIDLSTIILRGSSVSCRTTGGYNAKWNQKKPQARVFAAGSTLTFRAKVTQPVKRLALLGDRQGEGFGRVLLLPLEEVRKGMPSLEVQRERRERKLEGLKERRSERAELDKVRIDALAYADAHKSEFATLTPSLIGRVSLAARQSSSLADFDSRIAEITDDAKRTKVERLLDGMLGELQKDRDAEWVLQQQCLELVLRAAKYAAKSHMEGSDGR